MPLLLQGKGKGSGNGPPIKAMPPIPKAMPVVFKLEQCESQPQYILARLHRRRQVLPRQQSRLCPGFTMRHVCNPMIRLRFRRPVPRQQHSGLQPSDLRMFLTSMMELTASWFSSFGGVRKTNSKGARKGLGFRKPCVPGLSIVAVGLFKAKAAAAARTSAMHRARAKSIF